jgi:hypothetical protein
MPARYPVSLTWPEVIKVVKVVKLVKLVKLEQGSNRQSQKRAKRRCGGHAEYSSPSFALGEPWKSLIMNWRAIYRGRLE